MKNSLEHILRFISLVLIQIFVLNSIQISGYLYPNVYILFIMLLPAKFPKFLVLCLGLLLGIIIDAFTDSYGTHSSSTVLISYLRPKILSLVSIKGGEELENISMKHLKYERFFTYSGIICFIHHFTLFYLEAFRVNELFESLWRALMSSILTLILIFIIELSRSKYIKI
ncbi:MAG: rod shape-determining protein MreD [Flavobacteriales bacterium]|nr:rod shape-determining protein MreD [Flavobacteriales bacterium]|tara:strand:- start:3042 stop:3551 length:510 start_codon:yes stop_codon:yes gene_type:complete